MTDEDEAKMRALVMDAVGAVVEAFERRFDVRMLELEADVALALDKLDGIEIDVKDARVQVAKLSREFVKDRRRVELAARRLAEIERRVSEQEGGRV